MSAAAIGLGAQAAGAAISTKAQFDQMDAEAEAELINAKYFEDQAAYYKAASDRELDIFSRETDTALAAQKASFAKAGVDLSGSAIHVVADQTVLGELEKLALKQEGQFRANSAKIKADEAKRNAVSLLDPTNRMKIALGQVLSLGGSAASMAAANKGK